MRDQVFDLILKRDFEFDVTMLEKSKALPRIRKNEPQFFKYAWYYHFKYQVEKLQKHDMIVVAADINIKKQRQAFQTAVSDVVNQCLPGQKHFIDFCPSESDIGLQAADYCLWAIHRKMEKAHLMSYDLIKDKISSEFDLFRYGNKHYY